MVCSSSGNLRSSLRVTNGTAAIAAQGMTNIIENLNGILALGVGVGLMTIVGETLGAGRKEEASIM